MKISLFASLAFLSFSPLAFAVDLTQIQQKLSTTGVDGEVHGADAEHGLFVFTYRNPSDFFDYIDMSLVSFKPEITRVLQGLSRHDLVRIKGSFLDNPSPQKHIDVAAVEMLKKFASPYPVAAYEYEAKIPDELLNKESAVFLVHARHADGHLLVVEYKDVVLPIFVRNAELTKNLYRNDLVQLSFEVQQTPNRPMHLQLREGTPGAVQVLDSIVAKHGKPAVVEGALVFFPKSPEILFNVFAVLEDAGSGLKRQYTIVNMDDPAVFAKIRTLLQSAWDKAPGAYVNGRNKLISTRIRVRVTGVFNEVAAEQANAQILIASPDNVQILGL
ncbi:MAG: hypothetical protein ACXWPM_08345 [Bdellovibrionota bacterium]